MSYNIIDSIDILRWEIFFFCGIFYNEPRNDLFYVFVCISIDLFPINAIVGIHDNDNEVNVIILKGFSLIKID